MTGSLAAALEETLRAFRPIALDVPWADEIVFPHYHGLSIRNLAHTVVRLLIPNVPDLGRIGSSPLDARLWHAHYGEVRRVVLFLTDGLGWGLLQEIMAQDAATAQVIADLQGDGTLTPITSIAPSTTAAALPCIWTGAGPAATGMVGTELFLREFSTLANLLVFAPVNGHHRREVLEEWGLDFDTFLPVNTLSEALAARQIPTYLLLQKDLLGSGLSRVMHRGVKKWIRHSGYTDLWFALRELLRDTRRTRCFVNIYWNAVDSISHLYGTATEAVITEIRRQLTDLRDTLAAEHTADGHTLFMLAADHGHTPVERAIDLSAHPDVLQGLRAAPGGDERFTHLYLRADCRAAVADYFRAHFADHAAVLDPATMLSAGLFGPEAPYRESAARLGDLTVLLRAGTVLTRKPLTGFTSLSRHGGLSAAEMLVPLLLRRL